MLVNVAWDFNDNGPFIFFIRLFTGFFASLPVRMEYPANAKNLDQMVYRDAASNWGYWIAK